MIFPPSLKVILPAAAAGLALPPVRLRRRPAPAAPPPPDRADLGVVVADKRPTSRKK